MWETQVVTRSPKVVHLSAVEDAAGRGAHALAPIMHTVRQSAKKALTDLVQGLFNNVDDALFEMADRSRNDADQNMYFDSMRELRLRRKQMIASFVQHIAAGFDALLDKSADPEQDADADSMALMKNDDLEMSVAVAGIVSKITSQFSIPVMQLTRRIDSVCTTTVTERSNPLGPQRIADCFVAAMDDLVLDIKVRIILLKLFERHVMEQLAATYDEANRLMAEAGVLADLRTSVKKTQSRRSQPRAGQSQSEQAATSIGATSSDGGFALLQQLLAGTGGGHGNSAPQVTGPLISTTDLMTALSAAQTDISAVPIDIDQPPARVDLRQLVITRAVNPAEQTAGSMNRADEDTVNVIGMLFDFILNDRNLAIPMKALIARLQIPILKVAVIDKSFFGKPSHPARQLLNELSSAGIGWSSSAELKRDALYNKIESVVLRVLNNFEDDPTLFESLVSELRTFVNRDRHRAQIVEQRVKESESGKLKTIAAKQAVERLVNQKASGLRLPEEIGRFISDTMSRVLVYLCVRHGTDSMEWIEALTVFDDLLWSAQPLEDIGEVERRERETPLLLGRIEAGMRDLGLPQGDIETQISALQRCLEIISDGDRAFLEDDVRNAHDEQDTLPVMEEIVLSSADDRLSLADPDPAPELVRQINRLTEGVWVEMNNDLDERIRCKLAAIIQPGNKYIFVNRRGMKVAERNRMELATELESKALTILDESQVFDRALEAVIGSLRKMHR